MVDLHCYYYKLLGFERKNKMMHCGGRKGGDAEGDMDVKLVRKIE